MVFIFTELWCYLSRSWKTPLNGSVSQLELLLSFRIPLSLAHTYTHSTVVWQNLCDLHRFSFMIFIWSCVLEEILSSQRATMTIVNSFVYIPACVPLCRTSPLRTRSPSPFPQVLSLRFQEEQSQNRFWEQEATAGPVAAAADFLFAEWREKPTVSLQLTRFNYKN